MNRKYLIEPIFLLIALFIAAMIWNYASFFVFLATSGMTFSEWVNKNIIFGTLYNKPLLYRGLGVFLFSLAFIPVFLLKYKRQNIKLPHNSESKLAFFFVSALVFAAVYIIFSFNNWLLVLVMQTVALQLLRTTIVVLFCAGLSGMVAWSIYATLIYYYTKNISEITDTDMDKRATLKASTQIIAALGITSVVIPFARSLVPREVTSIDIDLTKIVENKVNVFTLASKAIYVLRRDKNMLNLLGINKKTLLDKDSDQSEQPASCKNNYRSINPEIFVADGLCTHLGCTTKFLSPGMPFSLDSVQVKFGAFLCPCHGAIFDLAGRVFTRMPATKNLRIPKHEYIDNDTIRVYGIAMY